MRRTICVVTGTRADYGLLRHLMRQVAESPLLVLQVVATGMHLSPEFGLTYREIEGDGFVVDRKIDMLLSADTGSAIGKSTGLGVIGFAQAFEELGPDAVLVLGDRFEILAAVTACLFARIPVIHLHGGELTAGAVDDAIRHAVSKMAHVHFVAAEAYRRRLVQLGEAPDRVFCVGGLGVDSILRTPLLARPSLEAALGISLPPRFLLVTFHPATLEAESPDVQMAELLAALEALEGMGFVFTMPNADAGGRVLMSMIERFASGRRDTHVFSSLGQTRYLSCLALSDGVVGNSSSGLLEAPTLAKGTVNIGRRQQGRLLASSVINCPPRRAEIGIALRRLLSPEFSEQMKHVANPYGNGGASSRILSILETIAFDGLVEKRFFDLAEDNLKSY